MSERLILGLDFGGTKLAAGIVALEAKKLVEAAHAPTPVGAGASDAISTMFELATRLPSLYRVTGIGVSFGGHVRAGRISRSVHVPDWENYPLQEMLEEHFGLSEIHITNDANATALGEWHFGAGKGLESLFYVTVSTGIGGGIILGGRIYEGETGFAGEIGHMKMVSDGPVCGCGSRGCLEALAAGPAIARSAYAALALSPDRVSHLRDYVDISAKTVADLAHQGDELATEVLCQAAAYLGIAIANVVNVLDVSCVIVGGGVARAGPIWWNALRVSVAASLLHWRDPIDLRQSRLGAFEGLWGAAAQFI